VNSRGCESGATIHRFAQGTARYSAGMKRLLTLAALTAVLATPLAALAQSGPPPDGQGPPPEIRAKMEQLRASIRTEALTALSADHRKAVQAVLDQVASGKLKDAREAAKQIDAIVTPDETKAVLATRDALRNEMRGMMGPPPGGAPQGGPPQGGPPQGGGDHHDGGPPRMNDAGFYLLQLSLTREQMRALMPRPPR
jgi:hypothetical protein